MPKLLNNAPLDDLLWDFSVIIDAFHLHMHIVSASVSAIYRKNPNISMPDAMRAASLELTDSFKRLKIRDYEAIEEIFANALERDKWPVNDKAFDHYAKALKLRRKLAEMEDTEEGGMATKRLKGNKSKVSKKNLDCV